MTCLKTRVIMDNGSVDLFAVLQVLVLLDASNGDVANHIQGMGIDPHSQHYF